MTALSFNTKLILGANNKIFTTIEQHKKTIYEAKTNYNLIKERAHYDFNLKKENIFKETINDNNICQQC